MDAKIVVVHKRDADDRFVVLEYRAELGLESLKTSVQRAQQVRACVRGGVRVCMRACVRVRARACVCVHACVRAYPSNPICSDAQKSGLNERRLA